MGDIAVFIIITLTDYSVYYERYTMIEKTHRNALQPGYRLHWYRIDHILGQGSFGITYLAHDLNLDRQVAIKEYLPIETAVREGAVFIYPLTSERGEQYHWGLERFIAEARMLATFEHPNIVRVLNVFEANNTAYMVMGYEPGENLQDVLNRRKRVEETELLMILLPILDGLEKIHQSGFIHRDIKPANIFIRQDGSPVLLDFGSARQAVGEQMRTLTSLFSPGYAPIEQYYGKGDQQGPWTDVYGLGATLYRGMAGVAPLDALERIQGILQASKDPFILAIEAGHGHYSKRFLQAIDQALSFQPGERPQTIGEWRRQFYLTLESSRPEPPPEAMEAVPTVIDNDTTARQLPPLAPDSWQDEQFECLRAQRDAAQARAAARRWQILTALCVVILGEGLFLWFQPSPMPPVDEPIVPYSSLISPHSSPPALTPQADEPIAPPKTGSSTVSRELSAKQHSEGSAPIEVPPAKVSPKVEVDGLNKALAPPKEEQINAFLAGASQDMKAGRFTRPKDNNALEKYWAVLALQPDHLQAIQGIQRIMEHVVQRAREAMGRADWSKAQAYLDEADVILPGSEAMAKAREELSTRKTEAQRRALAAEQEKKRKDAEQVAKQKVVKDGAQRAHSLIERAVQAMDRGQWDLAQRYVNQAAAIRPDTEDLILVRDELISRKAQAERPPLAAERQLNRVDPRANERQTGPENTTLVKIQKATASRVTAKAGDTVEFLTEYLLTLPEGARRKFVEATWVLKRNGKKIGTEGISARMVKAGVNSAANELTLPPRVKPGTYVVEHRVRAENSYDVAQSSFSVVAN
jgi:serine/threonine protein kinase